MNGGRDSHALNAEISGLKFADMIGDGAINENDKNKYDWIS